VLRLSRCRAVHPHYGLRLPASHVVHLLRHMVSHVMHPLYGVRLPANHVVHLVRHMACHVMHPLYGVRLPASHVVHLVRHMVCHMIANRQLRKRIPARQLANRFGHVPNLAVSITGRSTIVRKLVQDIYPIIPAVFLVASPEGKRKMATLLVDQNG
jgi:hypothetical protein